MKKNLILFITLILTTINAFGQTENQFKFEIDGTINADTGTIYLRFEGDYNLNKLVELVTQVKNNKFSFSGLITEPQGVMIYLDDRYRSSGFILEKGVQKVIINVDEKDKVPIVSNSTMLNEYPAYSAFFKQLNVKRDIFDQKYDSIYRLNNYQLPEDVRFSSSIELNKLDKEHDKLLLNYTVKNPNSKIAFWKLVALMGWGYEPIFDSIYNNFSDSLKNGYAGKVLSTKLLEGKQLSIGKFFPLIPCVDIENKPFALDLFKENRYTLVDFWYSKCGPCRAQFDKLKDLYSQYSAKGFEIVAISSDRESYKANWENVIKEDKLIWKQYLDLNGIETKKLSINAFPTNFLIDNSGKIIAKNISLGELEQLLNKTYKKEE